MKAYEELFKEVRDIALEAARWLREHHGEEGLGDIVKVDETDVTRRVDALIEDIIIDRLKALGVGGLVVSEEVGFVDLGKSNVVFIVDPLDGSGNYLAGIPYCSVSIAVAMAQGRPKLSDVVYGVVASVFTDEVFEAVRGKGAYYNGEPIDKTRGKYLGDTVLGYLNGDAFDLFKRLEAYMGPYRLRSLGSAALDLCLVAHRRALMFIDIRGKLRVTDVAAAALIVREAGGLVLNGSGESLDAFVEAGQRVGRIEYVIAIAPGDDIIALLQLLREAGVLREAGGS